MRPPEQSAICRTCEELLHLDCEARLPWESGEPGAWVHADTGDPLCSPELHRDRPALEGAAVGEPLPGSVVVLSGAGSRR